MNAGIFTAPRPTSRAGAHIRDAVILHWDPTSFCPSMQPGASWGIYSANATEHWLTSNASLQGRFSFQDCSFAVRKGRECTARVVVALSGTLLGREHGSLRSSSVAHAHARVGVDEGRHLAECFQLP